MNLQSFPSRLYRQGFLETLALGRARSVLALLVMLAVLGGKNLSAQPLTPQATEPTHQQRTPVQSRPAAANADAASTQHGSTPEPTNAARPSTTSPASTWPAEQPPNQAKVSWDSRGLEIDASNSSLNGILHQIATDAGAKLEGITTQDQRVFGNYGPGPVCDVLSKLLDGSGYNVLIIGSCDANALVEIVLSARLPASPQTAPNNRNSSNLAHGEQLEPKPQPDNLSESLRSQSGQDPFNIGGHPREPQEMMQEILDRQHQLDQQDQQNNPK